MKRALITGITGQDGAYLAQLLLDKNYEIHGIIRRVSWPHTGRIDKFLQNERVHIHYGDVTDSLSVLKIVQEVAPHEIYHLAAQSHVAVSFETPEYTAQVDGIATLRFLEAIRICGLERHTKFYQASTSELFGKVREIPQRETTPFYPRSPYAAAKLYAYWITINYREAYNIFACNGILFNHESPLRGENFVTRKITSALTRIALGSEEVLYLGNLNAERDWGYAPDYVHAMWLMLQQEKPEDFVIATGEKHSVREFVECVAQKLHIHLEWQGSGVHEYAVNVQTGKRIIAIDPQLFRPTEVDVLIGDATKARTILGWHPTVTFKDLVHIMVEADLKIAEQEFLSCSATTNRVALI